VSFFIFNYIEFNLDFFEISIDIDFLPLKKVSL